MSAEEIADPFSFCPLRELPRELRIHTRAELLFLQGFVVLQLLQRFLCVICVTFFYSRL